MPGVISNTSPLQYLFQADLLHLLPSLYGKIWIPQAVVSELAEGRRLGVPLPACENFPWLEVHAVHDRTLLPLVTHLGKGEKEVLALGLENPDSLLLLDDRNARRHAATLELQVSGTLGILLLAKERRFLDTVAPSLDRLQALQFRLHPKTLQSVLKLANEVP